MKKLLSVFATLMMVLFATGCSNNDDMVVAVSYTHLLNGKVAGVNINSSSSGGGGASKVVMRGTKSIEQSSNCLLYTSTGRLNSGIMFTGTFPPCSKI